MLCSRKNLVTKKIWRRGGGGGVPRFSDKICLSHRAEKFCRVILSCFTDFVASATFLEKRGGMEYQEFPSNCFCLTLPKRFVGEPISVSLFLGIDNFYASEC